MWSPPRLLVLLAVALGAALGSCTSDPEETCTPGEEGCECNSGQCLTGLACLSGLCVQPDPGATVGDDGADDGGTASPDSGANDDDGGPDGGASGDSDAATGAGGSAGESGDGGCQSTDGTIGCPCLAGNECLGDLTCDSQQTCICLSGTPCGESDCVEDFETDNRHCGSCGNACMTFGQVIGPCTLGECAPTLSECVLSEEATTCDAVCTAQGRSCVADGCGPNTDTWVQYGSDGACDRHDPEGAGGGSCQADLATVLDPDFIQDFVRCCCTP